MTFRWQTLGIAREYRLFVDKQIVGILKNDFWNRKAYGELRGFMTRFEYEGIGKKRARILDIEGEKVLGTIDFSFSPHSATIHFEGEPYHWIYSDTTSRDRWLVRNEEEKSDFVATGFMSRAGTISEAYLPPVVLLASLYIKGYFIKRSFLALAGTLFLGILTALLVGRLV